MKPITVYEADDGSRFDTAQEATAHERVNQAMQPLGPRPKLGDGRWVQHGRVACTVSLRMLVALYAELYPDDAERWKLLERVESIDPRTHVIGRMLDGNGPLARAWARLRCIDWQTCREYDQPFYALHPEQAGAEQTV